MSGKGRCVDKRIERTVAYLLRCPRSTVPEAMRAWTEGEQQSTSDGIDKGGRWLARERRRGDQTTTTVGDDERRERVADDDGSDEEGEGGQGDGDGN